MHDRVDGPPRWSVSELALVIKDNTTDPAQGQLRYTLHNLGAGISLPIRTDINMSTTPGSRWNTHWFNCSYYGTSGGIVATRTCQFQFDYPLNLLTINQAWVCNDREQYRL